MELKWLEDLVAVVEKGHFARAADARNITQSAFSRRIKSLEIWAGTELLDRTQHPVSLTPAGRDFLPYARDIIRLSYSAKNVTSGIGARVENSITIACLHTLALKFIPTLICDLRTSLGGLEASVVAETRTVEEYLEGLANGTSDLFVCYRHDAFPFNIDSASFPRVDIGQDRVLPYATVDVLEGADFNSEKGPPIPYLEYMGTSFLSRVVATILRQVPFRGRLHSVYRATLAESLCNAAISGLGLTWLPESIVHSNPRAKNLVCLADDLSVVLQISGFRSAANERVVLERVWKRLSSESLY